MDALLPSDYDDLVKRLRDDDQMWEKFYRYLFYNKSICCYNWVLLCRYYISDSVTRGAPDDEDRYDILCEAITTDSENDVKCRVWTSRFPPFSSFFL